MFINKFLLFSLLLVLAGCATGPKTAPTWPTKVDSDEIGMPAPLQNSSLKNTATEFGDIRQMAVLLPTSGANAAAGRSIQTSIQTAVLLNAPRNLAVSFYDTAPDANAAIQSALSINPDVIIGPLFSQNAQLLRDLKPETLPVISFTSDKNALGRGVMTMALLPTNSVESTIKEMAADNIKNFIIIAPDTETGKMLSGTAKRGAQIYNLDLSGIFYYTENNSESIKNATKSASAHDARTAANIQAKTILSDILTNEKLTVLEKSPLVIQLEKISKSDTLGTVPYDAILFLGNGNDTETLASFLRYYNVAEKDARFYGTSLWDGADIATDITMRGAKYSALPEIPLDYSSLYEQISGTLPNRLSTFGYDAANLAIGMIYSDKDSAEYLLNQSGYTGTDGLFRLKPNGENERALGILKTTGTATIIPQKSPIQNFISPVYNINPDTIIPADAMELETTGINPMDYITIPARLQNKYTGKTYGANITSQNKKTESNIITIIPESDNEVLLSDDFKRVKIDSVNRKYIDSVEIEE